jgi:hypothetical protein
MNSENLPQGWTKHYSNSKKKFYYHNRILRRSVWTLEAIERIKEEPKPEPEEIESKEDKAKKEKLKISDRTEILKKQLNQALVLYYKSIGKTISDISIKRYINTFDKIVRDTGKQLGTNKSAESIVFFLDKDYIAKLLKGVHQKFLNKTISFATLKNKTYALMTILNAIHSWGDKHMKGKLKFKEGVKLSEKQKKHYIKFIKDNYEKQKTIIDDFIKDFIMPEVKKLQEAAEEGKMTKKEKDKWIDYPELRKQVLDNLTAKIKEFKITDKKKKVLSQPEDKILQQYLIANLYLLDIENHMPIRNEYAGMLMTDSNNFKTLKDDFIQKNNFLVIYNKNKKEFILNNRKNKSQKVIKISKPLNDVINLYLKFYPAKFYKEKMAPFLLNTNRFNVTEGKKKKSIALSTNGLTKLLTNTIKSITGKKISTTMLRKIAHSHKYPNLKNDLKKAKEDAEKMGHSVKTALNYYNKTKE